MFLVCGEALFDVFVQHEDAAGSLHLDARLGGSPYNVAIGLARLGQRAAFFGGLSRDLLGVRLAAALEREGVTTTLAPRFDAPTTLGLVDVDAAGVPRYAFYGQGAADRLPDADSLPPLPADIKAIHLGSYTTVVDPVAATLESLVRRERADRLIAYDPNVRLNVAPATERWRHQVDTLAKLSHLVKISDEDAHLLYGATCDDTLAAQWLTAGSRLVIMTRGGNGATAWHACGRVDIPAPSIAVVDTVGAGDTFQAAMLAWLAENGHLSAHGLSRLDRDGLDALLGFAARAAAITCSRRGADLPQRQELGDAEQSPHSRSDTRPMVSGTP